MIRALAWVVSLLMLSPALAQAPKPAAKAPASQPAGPPKTLKQMLAPTLISLQCQGVTSNQAEKLLADKLGFDLEARQEADRTDDQGKITGNYVNQPFWTVIRDICKQGDLRVSGPMAKGASPFALALRRAENRDLMYFSAKSDLALVPTVTEFRYPRNYNQALRKSEDDRSKLQVTIVMLAEPKVFIAGFKRAVDIDQAIDEAGNSLIIPPDPVGGGGMRMRGGMRGGGWSGGEAVGYASIPRTNEFPTFWASIRPPAKTIKRLRGSVTLVFGFDIVTHDFSKVIDGTPAQIPLGRNGAITISGLRRQTNTQHGYQMDVNLPHIRLPNNNYTDETLEFRSMRFLLTDDQGNRFNYYGVSPQNIGGNEATYTARFWAPVVNGNYIDSKPTKLMCIVPTRLEETVVPFDFTDMPLTEPKIDQPGGGGPGDPGNAPSGNDKAK